MTRIKLTVAYDGTDFRGWAAQTGRRTVQSILTDAVRRVSGEENEIVGASRIDSGAHARGQVCHFDTTRPIEPERWVGALNRLLPADVVVVNAKSVHPEFNSRFWALDRTYAYRIVWGPRDPFRERIAYWTPRPLDQDAMRATAQNLVGRHDFRAFTEELDPKVVNTVREMFAVDVRELRDGATIVVRGTAFLRGMMRRMAGAILEAGRGKRDPESIRSLLDPERRDALTWPVVLPAKGLRLERIRYGRHPRDARHNCQDDEEN